jgi:hypothetical protein
VKRLAWAMLAVAVLAGTAGADSWSAVAPDGAGFRALLPGPPDYRRSSGFTPAGRIVEHLYRLEADGASFWITWSELPRLALWFAARDGIFENVRRDFLGRGEVRELSFGEAALGEHAGHELRYSSAERSGRGRLQVYLVGRRLFVFDATAWTSGGDAEVERFFDSLRLDPAPRR